MDSQENTLLSETSENRVFETTSNAPEENVINTEEASANEAAENPAAEQAEPSAAEEPSTSDQTAEPAPDTECPVPEEEPASSSQDKQQQDSKEAAPKEEQRAYNTKQEVLARVKEIVANKETVNKEEIDTLKTTFYKLHNAEREARLKEYLEAGGDPEKYQILPDEYEKDFKAEMSVIRERRAEQAQKQDAERQENLKKKLDIIEKIKAMSTSPDQANKSYSEFKQLQQQWKEIKTVPAERANELWRNYQLCVEQFYDLLKLNIEAREYDFKKNLETKTKLCEAAEKLADETDIISAFHQLQELHQQYRETGPVAKDLREDLWQRFKAASTVINKRHQQHFEALRSQENDNLARKTELCEKAESILAIECKRASDWEKQAKELVALQSEWKTIGFAPQKMNVKIFERFHSACDEFFKRKSDFFKQMKARYNENAAKKKALIERAKELSTSTEWRSTSDKLIALQKEWKTIGSVPKKLGDRLWEEFLTACNTFFEARKAANGSNVSEERANLDKKREIIGRMRTLKDAPGDDPQAAAEQLIDEYNSVGHVPYKEKDKLYEEYHGVLDELSASLNISVTRRKLHDFKNNLKQIAQRGEDALDNERSRLMRRYEQLKQEIQTYENNLGFLNASSKKGNSIVEEFSKKVQKLKDEVQLVKEKIKAIDAEDKEQ